MLVHLDGFDSYSVAADLAMEYTASISSFSTSTGRFGGGAITLSPTTQFQKSIAPTSEVWVGYAAKLTGWSTAYSNPLAQFNSGAGPEGSICVSQTGSSITIYQGDAHRTLIGTYALPPSLITGAWHWLEFHYKYGTSTGIMEMWCDGVQVFSFTGNTTYYTGGSISQIQIGHSTYGSVAGTYDDLYIIDVAAGGANTTRLGDCRIGTLVPTSNASPNQGTPSTGSAYTCVDEAQRNTSDYVTFTSYSAGLQELYGMSSLPSTPIGIFGVRVLAIGNKSDAGSAGFYPMVKSGGSSALATGLPLSTSWVDIPGIFETNPNTSAAWLTAAVNAMACGVQTV